MSTNGPVVIRRKSTKIIIRNPQSQTKDIGNKDFKNVESQECISVENALSWICSGLYSMLVVIFSISICLTYYITKKISLEFVKQYFTALFVASFLWITVFAFLYTSCCRKSPLLKNTSTNNPSNRWIKALLVLFGTSIIIENILEFVKYFSYPIKCRQLLSGILPVSQAMFVFSEVFFLLCCSKICFQKAQCFHRFGVMHLMATNLSVWILMVMVESTHMMDTFSEAHTESNSYDHDDHVMYNESKWSNKSDNNRLRNVNTNISDTKCTCNTSYCKAVDTAQSFLYPFAIEFSLISSCLLFTVWRNIGRKLTLFKRIIKPKFALFQSYKGIVTGGLVVVASIALLVVIKTSNDNLLFSHSSGKNQIINIRLIFLVVFESLMLLVGIIGLLLQNKNSRKIYKRKMMHLEVILLLFSLTGCIAINILYSFSAYLIYQNTQRMAFAFMITYPAVDGLQSVLQVIFITVELSRKPVTSQGAEDAAYDTIQAIRAANEIPDNHENRQTYISHHLNNPPCRSDCTNKTFIEDNNDEESNINSSAQIGQSIEESIGENKSQIKQDCYWKTEQSQHVYPDAASHVLNRMDDEQTSSGVCTASSQNSNNDSTSIENGKFTNDWHTETNHDANLEGNENVGRRTERNGHTPISIVSHSKISKPSGIRLHVRDLAMFLLVSNACLWVFLALCGMTFEDYLNHIQQFDGKDKQVVQATWVTAGMLCRPLSIFFRMHSSACLFEVWSMG